MNRRTEMGGAVVEKEKIKDRRWRAEGRRKVAQKDKRDTLISFTFDMLDNFTGGTSQC